MPLRTSGNSKAGMQKLKKQDTYSDEDDDYVRQRNSTCARRMPPEAESPPAGFAALSAARTLGF